MNKNGPIIVIEDDEDDQDILQEIFKKLPFKNEIIFFSKGNDLLEYLEKITTYPFLILSDVNMPGVNSFDLRNKVFDLAKRLAKPTPYLFFTTGSYRQQVVQAYSDSVQGFFLKPDSLDDLQTTLHLIISYWKTCILPDHYR